MATLRPYFGSSIEDLESLFATHKDDLKLLKKLQEELAHRSRPRARKLAAEIESILATQGTKTRPARNAAPQDKKTGKPERQVKPMPAPTIPEPTQDIKRASVSDQKPLRQPLAPAESSMAQPLPASPARPAMREDITVAGGAARQESKAGQSHAAPSSRINLEKTAVMPPACHQMVPHAAGKLPSAHYPVLFLVAAGLAVLAIWLYSQT